MDKEILQSRAQLVRIHEANCQIEHPTPEEQGFRMAIMKKLALEYGLRELRGAQFTRPGERPTGPTGPNRPTK